MGSAVSIATINPATGELVKSFDAMSPSAVGQRLDAAAAGYATLRATSFEQRAEWMRAAADLLDAEHAELAAAMTAPRGQAPPPRHGDGAPRPAGGPPHPPAPPTA